MPTTLILRHGDRFLDSVSKKRYHDAIRTKLGITVPTPEEEARDLVAADDVYKGATRLLRELTFVERPMRYCSKRILPTVFTATCLPCDRSACSRVFWESC